MTLASMTGFSRADGAAGGVRFAWELKSVNGKGLEIRLRLPPGLDALEPVARAAIGKRLGRGNVNGQLSLTREGQAPVVRVNEEALQAVVAALDVLRQRVDATPPSLDGLLNIRGVIEVVEPEEDAETRAAQQQAMLDTLELALGQLVTARRGEGAALGRILEERLETIARLTAAAEACPARTPEAIRRKLEEQIRALLGSAPQLDPDRLHQEALLLASKADIREELDRLVAHVAAARALLAEGGPVGRRLDFLAQELGRESNTLCAKSNDTALTAIGLELKAAVEQFREQVQNLE